MRFGICTSIENIAKVKAMGFDYLEASVSTTAGYSEEEFESACRLVGETEFPLECFNVLFPGEISLIGPGADPAPVRDYLHHAFPRIKRLGARKVVFGSGRSRYCPEGTGFARAYRELVAMTALIGETAAQYGIEIVIEPLNRTETNTINSLGEGAILAAHVNLPHVGLLADSYHMFMDGDPMGDIPRVGEIRHTHIACLEGRGYPLKAEGGIGSFFQALKSINYGGTMSIEGNSDDMDRDAPLALEIMKSLDQSRA